MTHYACRSAWTMVTCERVRLSLVTPTLCSSTGLMHPDPTPPNGHELPVAFMTSFGVGCMGVEFPLCDSILD
jgi:hypothetical protein